MRSSNQEIFPPNWFYKLLREDQKGLIKLHNFGGTLEQETYFVLACVSSGYYFLSFGNSRCCYFDRHPDQAYIPSQIDFKFRSFYSDQCIII